MRKFCLPGVLSVKICTNNLCMIMHDKTYKKLVRRTCISVVWSEPLLITCDSYNLRVYQNVLFDERRLGSFCTAAHSDQSILWLYLPCFNTNTVTSTFNDSIYPYYPQDFWVETSRYREIPPEKPEHIRHKVVTSSSEFFLRFQWRISFDFALDKICFHRRYLRLFLPLVAK